MKADIAVVIDSMHIQTGSIEEVLASLDNLLKDVDISEERSKVSLYVANDDFLLDEHVGFRNNLDDFIFEAIDVIEAVKFYNESANSTYFDVGSILKEVGLRLQEDGQRSGDDVSDDVHTAVVMLQATEPVEFDEAKKQIRHFTDDVRGVVTVIADPGVFDSPSTQEEFTRSVGENNLLVQSITETEISKVRNVVSKICRLPKVLNKS